MKNQSKPELGTDKITVPEIGLGDRIREARENRGLSQEGLSRLTKLFDSEGQGISRTVLTGYEKGKYKPGTRELRVLYFALGLTPNWLILGQSDPERGRAYKSRFGSEEEFESEMLKAIKNLDSDSLNGVAHLIFSASNSVSEVDKYLGGIDKRMSSVVEHLENELEYINKQVKKSKVKQSKI